MLCHQGLTLRRVGVNVSKFSTSLHKPVLKESFVFFFLFVVIQSLSVSASSGPHGLQHARLPCLSLSPGVCSNSFSLSQLCHPTISSFVSPSPPVLNLSQHQGLFQWVSSLHQVARLLELQHQSFQWIFRVLFFFFYDWLVWYPCCPRGSQESSPRPQFQSINFSAFSFLYDPAVTSVHDYWKIIALTIQTFVGKVMSMLLNMLSRFVIAFLPRSKRLFISWLQSLSTVILEPKKIKSATVSIVFSSICH